MSDREDFEVFWRKEMNTEIFDLAKTDYPMTKPEDQQYFCHETNRSWITWQAARGEAYVLRKQAEAVLQCAEENRLRGWIMASVEDYTLYSDLTWDAREMLERANTLEQE